MRTRSPLLSTYCCALALVCSCSGKRPTAEPASKEAAVIERIVMADRLLHEAVFGDVRGNAPRLIGQYTQALRNLDFSGCPRDFYQAFWTHIQAWEAYGKELELQPDDGSVAVVLGLFATMLGAPHSGAQLALRGLGDANRAARATDAARHGASEKVLRTWHQVEQIAITHGARLSVKAERGYLGCSFQAVTPGWAAQNRLPQNRCAFVASVVSDTPAAKAGLKGGDIVVQFNGVEVASHRDITIRVAVTPPGTAVPMRIVRDGVVRDLIVTVSGVD